MLKLGSAELLTESLLQLRLPKLAHALLQALLESLLLLVWLQAVLELLLIQHAAIPPDGILSVSVTRFATNGSIYERFCRARLGNRWKT